MIGVAILIRITRAANKKKRKKEKIKPRKSKEIAPPANEKTTQKLAAIWVYPDSMHARLQVKKDIHMDCNSE